MFPIDPQCRSERNLACMEAKDFIMSDVVFMLLGIGSIALLSLYAYGLNRI